MGKGWLIYNAAGDMGKNKQPVGNHILSVMERIWMEESGEILWKTSPQQIITWEVIVLVGKSLQITSMYFSLTC